jgi:CheY-like chemotaxis protein
MTLALIADDNPQNLYLLESILKGHHFKVVSAKNGAEALDEALKNPPDLIIADILMPVMDGFELCRRVKADGNLNPIPVVFYTSTYTEAKDEQFAMNLGAERFVTKPQKPDELVRIVREILDKFAKESPPVPKRPLGDEMEILREYNEVLFRKLEKKVMQLEEEIAERKNAEEVVRTLLEEKIVLLREVHHRVKNNFQILISLLNLQSRTISDPQVIAALKESTQRIRAMSMVHEKLYTGGDLAHIEFINYLSSLANSQVSFYGLSPGRIKLEIKGENIMLDINTAIPLGLVMNELVSNALKHAFPGDRKGTIRIDA